MAIRKSTIVALSTAGAMALAMASSAHATTVATIDGSYDTLAYDTIGLTFHNTSGGTLTNAKMVLLGYQGDNSGLTKTITLGTLAAGDTNEIWGSLPGGAGCCGVTPGDLSSYDYDDSDPNTISDSQCVIVPSLCAKPGNFKITFTATVSGGAFDGSPVFSVFSPTTNFTGGFVGFEGLTPDGVSESTFDVHSGTLTGTLAVIDIGLPPSGTPEPATWAMMLLGFGGLGAMLRSKRRAAATA